MLLIVADEQVGIEELKVQDIVKYEIIIKFLCKFYKFSVVFEPKLVLFPTVW